MKIDQPEGLDEYDIVAEPTVSEAGQPATGTVDDDDDPDDEREYENEAPVRERSDATEAPEEFEVDDEDQA